MIANYGYEDGSGVYYISIDTDKCTLCTERACVSACPSKVFVVELDDYDDEVAMVKQECIRILKSCCSSCKGNGQPTNSEERLACEEACKKSAIKHTWY